MEDEQVQETISFVKRVLISESSQIRKINSYAEFLNITPSSMRKNTSFGVLSYNFTKSETFSALTCSDYGTPN